MKRKSQMIESAALSAAGSATQSTGTVSLRSGEKLSLEPGGRLTATSRGGRTSRTSASRGGARSGKYGNRKTEVDGIVFDSTREARRYRSLKLMETRKEISGLRLQVVYELVPGAILGGRKRPPVRYVADFVYRTPDGVVHVEDAKGCLTSVYKLKRHLMKAVHGIDIEEV